MRPFTRGERIAITLGLLAAVAACHVENPVENPVTPQHHVWHVASDGSGDLPTIQAAIVTAQAGDIVLLAPGTYTWAAQHTVGIRCCT